MNPHGIFWNRFFGFDRYFAAIGIGLLMRS
jgi:hypothetical protein